MAEQNQLLALWNRSEEFVRLRNTMENMDGSCALFGISETASLYCMAALASQMDHQMLIVTDNEGEAQRMTEDLRLLMKGVVYFPAKEIFFHQYYGASRTLLDKQLAALSALYAREATVCIASIDAFMQAMTPSAVLRQAQIEANVGEVFDIENLPCRMMQLGYERVEKISGNGQFRLNGSIFDVFAPNSDEPIRIELFDDEIDSIRRFDVSTQRSLDKLDHVVIPSATEVPLDSKAVAQAIQNMRESKAGLGEKQLARLQQMQADLEANHTIDGAQQYLPLFHEPVTLMDHLARQSWLVLPEANRIYKRLKQIHESFAQQLAQAIEDDEALPFQGQLLFSPEVFRQKLEDVHVLGISTLTRAMEIIRPDHIFQMESRAAVQYSAAIPMLAEDVAQMRKNMAILLFAGKHAETLQRDLQEEGVEAALLSALNREPEPGEILVIHGETARGFEDRSLHVAVFSEQDIYGHQKRKTKMARKTTTSKMDLFSELKTGDYVVHEKYGIGVFQGIETHTAAGISRDFFMIQYAGYDRVGVSTDDLDRVQKFIGRSEAAVPRISKLGGAEWSRTVARTRASVKALAFDLVKLYAKRQEQIGFAFSADTIWQRQLEDSFEYEETPGQLNSLEEIKHDMESKRVMDRLLCGDVGYGKTEVALRAAFKAVQDSKQVAFLAPTTILVQQHYLTLMRRFEAFPITIDSLSRLRSSKQQKETLKRLQNGQVDVLVGTHRLLGKDVKFHDLGLLIVDEEQRFGVGHKELIKNLKQNVDVLTLSATPIPRTLHMSMLGIRDMSVIDTPPEERYPVTTYVIEFSEVLLAEAIRKEMKHGGQVYIVYNRVANMENFVSECQKIVPEAQFGMAHGQMKQGELENVMLAFMDNQFDVLVCSTIIESGVDIPNVNTLIVYDADHFGLSQLYQLRGRVGRSNRMAYAYFTFQKDKVLNEIAEKRLQAIRDFTEFGSGFKVAMQDLEIRGAGNLLGVQQHGHMDDVGYDYYCKLIEEAVQELQGDALDIAVETQMDITMDAFIPHDYIDNEARRLEMYKRISAISSLEDMYDVQEELEDRFGTIPVSVQNLLDISLLKSHANVAQIEQIVLRAQEAKIRFHPQSSVDMNLLFGLIQQKTGWKFVPDKQTVKIQFHRKSASIDDIFQETNSLVEKICDCIRPLD